MDWLTQLLSSLGPSSAAAAGLDASMPPTGPYTPAMKSPPPMLTPPNEAMMQGGNPNLEGPPAPVPPFTTGPMSAGPPVGWIPKGMDATMFSGGGAPYSGSPIPPPEAPAAPATPPPPSLGVSLDPAGASGSPAGLPVQAGAPGAPLDILPSGARSTSGGKPAAASPLAAPGNVGDRIAAALRGVTAPPPRDVVKPSTPAAPQMKSIQAGQLFALMDQLSNPAYAQMTPQRSTTLGGALGTGRY